MSAAGKICGPCRACCTALKIKAPHLRKKSGAPCPNLTEQGCGIYETRPQVCRDFLCGWRLLPALDVTWRPDASGVMLLRLSESEVPHDYRAAPGWVFVILDEDKALTPRLARHVAGLVARKAAVYLSAVTPRVQLNEQLQAPVAAGDLGGVLAVLKQVHARLLPARSGGLGGVLALYRAQLDRVRAKRETPR